MKAQITVYCPRCQGHNIKQNGKDGNQKQRYACKSCKRRFIGDHNLTYKGCHSQSDDLVCKMTARGNGIRDICAIMGYSRDKVQAALKRSEHEVEPTQKHYDILQVDEFHTFVGNKKNKVWLIYAYCKKTGEIVAYVWGKRDLKTALALKQRLRELKITYGCIASDDWDAFVKAFSDADDQWVGKQHTQAIEGNNCAIRHRVRRAVRKSCCFSKSLFYHKKAFNIGFAYINECHLLKR